jgi:hypothetical protein
MHSTSQNQCWPFITTPETEKLMFWSVPGEVCKKIGNKGSLCIVNGAVIMLKKKEYTHIINFSLSQLGIGFIAVL